MAFTMLLHIAASRRRPCVAFGARNIGGMH